MFSCMCYKKNNKEIKPTYQKYKNSHSEKNKENGKYKKYKKNSKKNYYATIIQYYWYTSPLYKRIYSIKLNNLLLSINKKFYSYANNTTKLISNSPY